MSGFLDHYGEGDARREKIWKRVVLISLAVLIAALAAFFGLRNYRQKARVSEFASTLQKKDYQAAYRFWGCSDASPCPDYSYEKFLEDWGPKSPYADVASYSITRSRRCGDGVIVIVNFGASREEKFWVEGPDLTIGYSPWPVCPPR